MASELTFLYDLLIALAIGALIGLEREHHRDEHLVLAGIRTFPLVSGTGVVLSYLASLQPSLGIIVVVGLLVIAAFAIGLMYFQYKLKAPGFTTPLALVVTYAAGVLVGYGLVLEAVALSVATTFLLVSKRHLHGFAQILTEAEMIGALEFITISFILYPLTLELELTGPWTVFESGGPLDLSTTVLIVIFVSSISFVSFLIVRWKGASRGLRFSGLLGGLVNSEAATASMCTLANERKGLMGAAASGVILANATMFVRNLVVSMFADPTLETAAVVALPLLGLFVMGAGMGMMMRVEEEGREPLRVRSPFAIPPALKFGIMFVVVSAATIVVQEYVGTEAVYLAALGGFISSAAVAASVSSLVVAGQVDVLTAGATIMLACAISTLNKLLISRAMSRDVHVRIRIAIVSTAAVTVAASLVVLLIRIVL